MEKLFYETKTMIVTDTSGLFRYVTKEFDEGMIVVVYEEWQESERAWKAVSEVSMSHEIAMAVASHMREVAGFLIETS